jgi:signal transduction histidine kinase
MSIRIRILLMVNTIVVLVVIVFGLAAARIGSQLLEQRLVARQAENTSRFLESYRFPVGDQMMDYLHDLMGVQFGVVDRKRSQVVASSLTGDGRDQLIQSGPKLENKGNLTLAKVDYLYATAPFGPNVGNSNDRETELVILVPRTRMSEARRLIFLWFSIPAAAVILISSLLSIWLARRIARPIEQLTNSINKIAEEDDPTKGAGLTPRLAPSPNSPQEVIRLAASFNRLLTHLAHSQKMLIESERLATVGKTAAGIVHELRNPLSGIRMNARILQEELASEGKDDPALATIERETERLDLILEELVLLARDGQCNKTPNETDEKTDFRTAVDSVLALLAGRMKHAGATINCDIDQSLPRLTITGQAIRQILMNLLINAIEAMPEGGRIRLEAQTPAPDHSTVTFSISDEGPGVDLPEGTDPFEPFVTGKSSGTGLGLYITRKLVQEASGTIKFKNTPQGACFSVELPAK